MNAPLRDEKELPLREDTRLLGRILGDVLRTQTGDAGFERVEARPQSMGIVTTYLARAGAAAPAERR